MTATPHVSGQRLLRRIATVFAVAATAASATVLAPTAEAADTTTTTTTEQLAVQVSGVFADTTDTTARAARTDIVVGTVDTNPLGFADSGAAGTDVVERNAFRFSVVCATTAGDGCADGTEVYWDFGDGTTATSTVGTTNPGDVDGGDPLTYLHPYTNAGAYTVRVTVDDQQTPAYGTGAIRALVGPRFADVDAAYATASGAGKTVNPTSESVWAVTALGLMAPCKPYYSSTSSIPVTGERAEDTGRAMFCPQPGQDPTAADAVGQTAPTTNPVPRSGYSNDGWTGTGTFTNASSCLALADNCGLPAEVFVDHGNPRGSPLAACSTNACQNILANRKILTSDKLGLWYDPTNCADNRTAVRDGTGTTTLRRGVEAGCETRGDFLQALLKAVDATGTESLGQASGNSVALDNTFCPTGPGRPAADGSDGVRRATALLSAGGDTMSPCDPDAALTKGEAYRMLAAAVGPAASTHITLPDLEDRSLGTGTAQPYPHRASIYSLLDAGAPLVGSVTCPATTSMTGAAAVCFNPYQPMTRAQAARLLAYFVLGDTSDVAAVQVRLTADANQVTLGSTVQLQMTVAAPAWLLPYQANWTFAVAGGVDPKSVAFACPTSGTGTVTGQRLTVTCPVTILRQPATGRLPLKVTVNGKDYPPVTLRVLNTAPTANTVTLPTLSEDAATGTADVAFDDHENNDIVKVQVSTSTNGPWSDAATTTVVTAAAGSIDNSQSVAHVQVTPRRDANGPYTFYVRVCDFGDACSKPIAAKGTVSPVNDAPIAYPISNVIRNDNIEPVSGDCSTVQDGPAVGNLVQLRGDDPVDDGQSGYTTSITAYRVTAPAAPVGKMYVCGSTGAWTLVAAGTTAETSAPFVLFNPTPGQYASGTYSYLVVDGGSPTGGLASTPQPIAVINTEPGVAPVAALGTDLTTGAAGTSDFTFSAASSADDGNTDAIVSYSFDFGDGQHSTTQASALTHRFTEAGTYTATATVTDAEGLTDSTTIQVTVTENLLDNATLDDNADGWEAGPRATLDVTSTDPHGGAGAGKVALDTGSVTASSPPEAALGEAARRVRVEAAAVPAACSVATTPTALDGATVAGQAYDALAWVRPTPESAGLDVAVTISEADSEGDPVGSIATTATLGAAGHWQQVPLRYIAAGDDSTLSLTLGVDDYTGSVCFSFDDMSLTPTT